MTAHRTYMVAAILTLIGVMLLAVVGVFVTGFLWCTDSEGPLASRVCGEGHFSTVAVALIGAASAMWGAHTLRRSRDD